MSSLLNINTDKTSTTEVNIQINGAQILELLRNQVNKDIPDNASIVVNVPRGGDYSGMDIDIKYEPIITIAYKYTS